MKKWKIGLWLAVAAVALTACGTQTQNTGKTTNQTAANASSQNETAAEAAPLLGAFTSQDLDGNAMDQDILADHAVTMINIWSTTCGYCIKEMPGLAGLQADYADQGFQVIGICLDVLDKDGNLDADAVATAKKIMEQTGATYQQLAPSDDLYTLVLQYISGTPTSFFVDSKGNQLGTAHAGYQSEDEWKETIEPLLTEANSGEKTK